MKSLSPLSRCMVCAGSLIFCTLPSQLLGQTILGDSSADWLVAVNDGIDIDGAPTTTGSADDAAQQNHSATSNGTWSYRAGNSPGGSPFSGGIGLLDNWNGVSYWGGETVGTRVSREFMSPVGTIIGNTYSQRRWQGSGLNGETLRISGDFLTTETGAPVSATNNGVDVHVLLNGFTIFTDTLFPNADQAVFDITTTIFGDNPSVTFAVGPQGPGPVTSIVNDFFNDAITMRATIALIPEASSVSPLLGAFALAFLSARRRRV